MDKLGLGRKMEQAVMRRWEWYGFRTWQPARSKYASQDIFGLFDFIAVKPYCPVNLVQVKRLRRSECEKALDAIKAFADQYNAPVAPFLVTWKAYDARTSFQAWQYGLTGWFNAGEWNDAGNP